MPHLLGLHDGAGEAIKQEALAAGLAANVVLNQTDDNLVAHEL
jgi:hypothetical protein